MNPLSLPIASLLMLAPVADGWLGVFLATDREQAVVAEVIPASPAATAGLQVGDELIAVGDLATPTRDELIAAIRGRKAGERLRLKVRRDGKESFVTVRLGERPQEMPAPDGGARVVPAPPKQGQPPKPAAETAPIQAVPHGERKAYLGLRVREADGGVVVDEALSGGPADGLGIRTGERITTLGDRKVSGLADLDAVLQRSEPGAKLPIGLRSAAGTRSLTVTLGALPAAASTRAAPAPSQVTVRPTPPPAIDGYDVEGEIEALRRELRELRLQLEQMRLERSGAGAKADGRE